MQIVREVKNLGNGAHVIVPRKWLEAKVVISLVQRNVKEEILELILPYLKDIKGVYLYGSCARNEVTVDSDVDVLIISDKKMHLPKEGFEILVVTQKEIEKTLKNNAVMILPILKECIPIINGDLISKYKTQKLTKQNTKWYLDTTKTSLNIARELIKQKDIEGISNIVYPLVMRIKGLYLMQQLINSKKYSTKNLENYLYRKSLSKEKIWQFLKMYRENRDKKQISKHSLNYTDVKLLYIIAISLFKEVKWEKQR